MEDNMKKLNVLLSIALLITACSPQVNIKKMAETDRAFRKLHDRMLRGDKELLIALIDENYLPADKLFPLLEKHNPEFAKLRSLRFRAMPNKDQIKSFIRRDRDFEKLFPQQARYQLYCEVQPVLVGGLVNVKTPMHEKITEKALSETLLENDDNKDYKTNLKVRNIIRGVFWNDDPEMLLFEDDYVQNCDYEDMFSTIGAIRLGIRITRGESADCALPNKTMTVRSHFCDLQFLHSMEAEGIAPADTRKKLFDWMEFTYRAATSQINQYEISAFTTSVFGRSVTLEALFNNGNPNVKVADIALGSLLHIIQDSYMVSHTERKNFDSVISFLCYKMQNSDSHGKYDKFDGLDIADTPGASRASDVCAGLLKLYMRKASWTDVHEYLDGKFVLSEDAKLPYAGKCCKKCM
jgi:hypothetical protein